LDGIVNFSFGTWLKLVGRCIILLGGYVDYFCDFQVGENEPFVSELLTGLPTTVGDLEPHQIHTFYEAVCLFMSSALDISTVSLVINNLYLFFLGRSYDSGRT
jgi:exportin-1